MEPGPVLFRSPLRGRGLAVARVVWLLVVVPTLALTAFGFAVGIANPIRIGPESILVALDQANIDPAMSIVVGLVLPLVLMTAIGGVMFWKRSADPMVLLTSLAVIMVMAAFTKSPFAAMSAVPELEAMVRAVFFVAFGSLVLLFALFPNGRSVPSRAWMFAPAVAVTVAVLPDFPRALAMLPDRPIGFDQAMWTLNMMFVLTVLTLVVVGQVYRYRKVSTVLERLQAKWVILPFGVTFVQLTLVVVLAQPAFGLGDVVTGWAQLSLVPVALLSPLGLAAAILRYRLYDIERIVSRTVSYGLLTVLLFSLYAALVFLIRQLTPTQGDLAVAGSTLGVAALANPMRRRVQHLVDLRFNRSHTDAARTLTQFTHTLRTATDLQAVASELQAAVARTFQPDRVSIWVRSDGKRKS